MSDVFGYRYLAKGKRKSGEILNHMTIGDKIRFSGSMPVRDDIPPKQQGYRFPF
jgi:hypothetical protein